MAARTFLTMFNEAKEKEHFFSFKHLICAIGFLTPDKRLKAPLNYSQSLSEIVENSKESIVRNLCLNPTLEKIPAFETSMLKDLVTFCVSKDYSDNDLAQCLFLMHVGKTDCHKLDENKAFSFFCNCFGNFRSIDTQFDITQNELFVELKSIFSILMSTKAFTDAINNSIDKIVVPKANTGQFNFQNLKLIFFSSKFRTIYGYSGKDRLYVNVVPIFESLEKHVSEEQKILVIKLNFIRLIVHEASHVLLRFKLDDLNLSSPFLDGQIKGGKVFKNIKECGFETEKEFFKGCIDWDASMGRSINLSYCKEYLDKILNGVLVDFDISLANVFSLNIENFHSSGFSIRLEPDLYML
ncbi:hypothetical protein BpHYR1_054024 [Brachionus plicatilis]|uniref:Uncharacterized protein n=1 Tax=Brachionus plicatilis TaxID=10195 RepID=A0A3M7P5P7_BRAPC|nr:hypothetical protein BpHYR1_054024 [Brachionus plicatilis]